MSNSRDYWVECNVCGQRYKNWAGSTPCCGSLAFEVGVDGKKGDNAIIFASIDGGKIEEVKLNMGK